MSHKTKLKVCGVTTPEDAQTLVELGVDAIGINFYPKSKRYIKPEDAKPFLDEIKGEIERIGVFVDEDIAVVKQLIAEDFIDVAQLHGNEDNAYCQEFINHKIDFIRVIRVQANDTSIKLPKVTGNRVLLDTHVTGYGGAGESFDWNLATQFMQDHPDHQVIMAGGITPENIAEACKIHPHMIDVASGVESSPGIKDQEKILIISDYLNK